MCVHVGVTPAFEQPPVVCDVVFYGRHDYTSPTQFTNKDLTCALSHARLVDPVRIPGVDGKIFSRASVEAAVDGTLCAPTMPWRATVGDPKLWCVLRFEQRGRTSKALKTPLA